MSDNITDSADAKALDLAPSSENAEPNPLTDKYNGDVDKLNQGYAEADKKITELSQQLAESNKSKEAADETPATDAKKTDDTPASKEGEGDNTDSPEFYDEAVETYGQGMADIFQAADLNPFPEWEKFDKDGELSDEAYEKLDKIGYDKDTVKTYLDGYAQNRDEGMNGVIESLGGADQLGKIQAWIANTWSEDQKASHNAVLETGDLNKINEHAGKLKAAYEKQFGIEPTTVINGLPGGETKDVYRSTYEMQQDMAKPEYKQNPAFRAEVAEKLSRSSLFGSRN